MISFMVVDWGWGIGLGDFVCFIVKCDGMVVIECIVWIGE